MNIHNSDTEELEHGTRNVKHLAAHAVLAFRAGFRVERVSLKATSNQSGITCNWKEARGCYRDDAKLINRSFALAYIGEIVDQDNVENLSDELREEIKADMVASEDSRETAVAWNLVESVRDINPFAHIGYKLASRLIRKDKLLIEKLAAHLLKKQALDEKSLLIWLQENASPYSLDELEKANTY